MKANSKKISNKKPSTKKPLKEKGCTPKGKRRLARHEAAHFVTAWAVGCPALCSDITKAAQKDFRYDQRYVREGYTGGWADNPDSFQRVAIGIAGPIADNWGKDANQIIEGEKGEINEAIEAVVKELAIDHFDIADAVEDLCCFCDITDRTQFKHTLALFIDAVREILSLCETQWGEVEEYLIEHGRIGFTGKKINGMEIHDQGQEAGSLFIHWEKDGEEPPKAVRDCVKKYRLAVDALPKEPVEFIGR